MRRGRGKRTMGNVTSSVAACLAFFPAELPTYGVEPAQDGAGAGEGSQPWLLRITAVSPDAVVEVRALPTRAGMHAVSAFWRHPAARLTLLYTGGNAADLEQSRLWRSLPPSQLRPQGEHEGQERQRWPLGSVHHCRQHLASHSASSLLTATTMGCYFVGSPVTSPKRV
ncbi:hypothetical protein U9M48_026819 [Paspalum notatum var. saurae]|uniref:Uncharacterized protein n=1 Tax=Paspalum notatum var. saurae TaxID=547442 RepID=A0AAQ3WYQ6_PASNO